MLLQFPVSNGMYSSKKEILNAIKGNIEYCKTLKALRKVLKPIYETNKPAVLIEYATVKYLNSIVYQPKHKRNITFDEFVEGVYEKCVYKFGYTFDSDKAVKTIKEDFKK